MANKGKCVTRTSMSGGGTIVSSYPRDNSSSMSVPNDKGKSMGGGVTNLSHSLSGASAVQRNGSGSKD